VLHLIALWPLEVVLTCISHIFTGAEAIVKVAGEAQDSTVQKRPTDFIDSGGPCKRESSLKEGWWQGWGVDACSHLQSAGGSILLKTNHSLLFWAPFGIIMKEIEDSSEGSLYQLSFVGIDFLPSMGWTLFGQPNARHLAMKLFQTLSPGSYSQAARLGLENAVCGFGDPVHVPEYRY
jgi:hypothetical protein